MPVASGPVKQVLRFTFGSQDPLVAVDWCRNVDGADRMCVSTFQTLSTLSWTL